MSEFVFFELEPDVRRALKLPPHPIPVRRDRQNAIFLPGGQLDFPAMLEEVRVFLDENPALAGDYNHLLAMLAYLSGMDAAARGFHEQALHLYEMGLDAVPDSIALRSHYALSLHCLGREVEARREIEQTIASTPKDTILPVLWMILARIYARDGEYEKAYWLLKDVSTIIPEEEGFWDFLAEMEERAGLRPAPVRPSVTVPALQPAPLWHYAEAGQTMGPAEESFVRARLARGDLSADTLVWNPALPDWITASAAGLLVPSSVSPSQQPANPPCQRCHKALEPGSRFCKGCGLPVETVVAVSTQKSCPKCAAQLEPGVRFCTGCGFTQS